MVNYKRLSLYSLAGFALIRIVISLLLDLGNDESYYWTYARELQWNYFDHPPMIGVWIRSFTLNLLLQDHVLFITLGSIVGAVVSSWFIFRTIEAIDSARSGFLGVILYNCSFYALITAGVLAVPDAPQMVFWTGSMLLLTRIVPTSSVLQQTVPQTIFTPGRLTDWILFGICSGLCIMSKIHGVFVWFGLLLYAGLYARQLFSQRGLWIAMLITAVIVFPILWWNWNTDFVTFRFHGNRVVPGDGGSVFQLQWFVREIAGELVVNSPVILALTGWFLLKKRRLLQTNPALRVFVCCGLPLLIIILTISLFRQTLPHWSGPAYVAMLPALAIAVSRLSSIAGRRLIRISIGFTAISMFCLVAAINLFPGTFYPVKSPRLGNGDLSLDNYGWEEAGQTFGTWYRARYGATAAEEPMVCATWWGAHEEYYFARPVSLPMIGLGNMAALHHYSWLNDQSMKGTDLDTALCVIHSDDYFDPDSAFADYYKRADLVKTIPIDRNKRPAHVFYVYELTGRKGEIKP